jgi:hypothetical protein
MVEERVNKKNQKIHFRSDQKIRRTGQIVKSVIGLNFPAETSAGHEEMTGCQGAILSQATYISETKKVNSSGSV